MIACGVDVESIERIERLYKKQYFPFGLFSGSELKHITTCGSAAHSFVAKEAILKSFGSGWFNTGIDAHDIQLLFDEHNIPHDVLFHGKADEIFKMKSYDYTTLEYFYVENNLLASFVMSVKKNEVKKSVLALSRRHGHDYALNEKNICKVDPMCNGKMMSAKKLGRLAVRLAIKNICNTDNNLMYEDKIIINKFGAPVWGEIGAQPLSNVKNKAISISHNRNYACGAAVCI